MMGARIKAAASFLLVALFVFLAYGPAAAVCFQTHNDDLIKGSVDEVFPGLVGKYLVSVPKGEIYFVNKNNRVSYKVCDSDIQKNAFIKKWSPVSDQKQGWVLVKKSNQVIKPADLARNGFYKVKQSNNLWYLWEWKALEGHSSDKWYFLVKTWSKDGVVIKFGDVLEVIEEKGDSLDVKTGKSDKQFNFDRAVLTKSKSLIDSLSKAGKIPTSILIISKIKSSGDFSIKVGSSLRMSIQNGKMVPLLEDGNCLYFRGKGKSVALIKFPTYIPKQKKVVKVEIKNPQYGSYYYYRAQKTAFDKLFTKQGLAKK